MRKILTIALILCVGLAYAQEEIQIKDIEIPTAPALMILDNAPTDIETPRNVKAVTASLLNGLGENTAIEFTPYFFLEKRKNYYSYNNYERSGPEGKRTFKYKGVFSNNMYSNLSVSFGSVKTDSTQNLSLGIRTNLIKLKSKKYNDLFLKTSAMFEGKIRQFEVDLDPDELKESKEYQAAIKTYNSAMDSLVALAERPLFSLDVAAAYNHFFEGTEYSEGRAGKYGAWATLSYNPSFDSDIKTQNNYLSLYVLCRYLKDRMNFDPETGEYADEDFFDYGGKVELQLNKLSIAYEYVKRDEDNYRSVGSLKYVLYDQVALTGGFGKNFDRGDNLVTYLGVSWGLDFGNTFTKENNTE